MSGIVLATNAAGCLFTLGAAPLLAGFFDEPRLVPLLRVLSINFLLLAAYVLPQSQLMRELDFRTKARVDILAIVLAALVTLGLALAGFGVWSLVAGSLVTHGVKAVAFNLVRPVAVAPVFSLQAVTHLAQFGALVTLDRLLFFLYGQADVVIGGRGLGKEALGVYAVALALAAVPMDKLLPIVTQVSFAAFSRIQSEPDRVQRNLLWSVRMVSLICFPAFLGMAAVAGDLVAVFLGPRWHGVIVPIQLLCLVLPLKTLSALLPPPLFAVGRPALNVINTAISLIVILPLTSAADPYAREDLAFALSVVLLGLLMMITRRNAVSQVVGFMSIENGLILAATGAKGMPLVVEISVAFSILVALIVIGIFLFRIRERFETVDIHLLHEHRGEQP